MCLQVCRRRRSLVFIKHVRCHIFAYLKYFYRLGFPAFTSKAGDSRCSSSLFSVIIELDRSSLVSFLLSAKGEEIIIIIRHSEKILQSVVNEQPAKLWGILVARKFRKIVQHRFAPLLIILLFDKINLIVLSAGKGLCIHLEFRFWNRIVASNCIASQAKNWTSV